MRLLPHRVFLSLSLAVGAAITGCAGSSTTQPCTATPFISPAAVTLDHTSSTNNLQYFGTGYRQSGSNCITSALAIKYYWTVSDPVTANVADDGGVSCKAASLAPITVSSTIQSIDATGKVVYLPTSLPSASLTCK